MGAPGLPALVKRCARYRNGTITRPWYLQLGLRLSSPYQVWIFPELVIFGVNDCTVSPWSLLDGWVRWLHVTLWAQNTMLFSFCSLSLCMLSQVCGIPGSADSTFNQSVQARKSDRSRSTLCAMRLRFPLSLNVLRIYHATEHEAVLGLLVPVLYHVAACLMAWW